MTQSITPATTDFVSQIIENDLRANKHGGRVTTRFPPEPNGYLHIGHAKSICLNFGIAEKYQGACNLRLDDTDPSGESMEYVESIIHDVRWLGFDWGDRLFYSSNYFEQLYSFAVELIKTGNAYVCSLNADDVRERRGSFTESGTESPYRSRTVEENLDMFSRMRQGEFDDGAHTLRARIDMSSPNLVMRDPVIFRIKREPHYRTGSTWAIYPMYDFAHCLSDAMEGITHSICTLEFENNRPLYDWIVEKLISGDRPQQIEFARLNLSYTILSKRRLIELVKKGFVQGWDDPRLPTLAGMRRRGFGPQAIRNFCMEIGVAKNDNLIDLSLLEHCVREDLNDRAPRAMCILRPLRVVIDNYPEGEIEQFECPNHPQHPEMGARKVPFSKVLYIERDDFLEDPPKKYHRLGPGREVRLRNAYVIAFESALKDEKTGEVLELHCTYDPTTRDAPPADGRKVQGVIHWVAAEHCWPVEVRLYDRLFSIQDPGSEEDFTRYVNPDSLQVLATCYAELNLKEATPGSQYQFERLGYFCADEKDTKPGKPVFNRIVPLRDSWAKMAAGEKN